MAEYIDQMNQTIRLDNLPRRIVSLVPSQTELLYDLGLGDSVVGITKFCIYPEEWYRNKTRVGGTKDASYEKIKALQPDLIIGNKEENQKENIEQLREIAPVWMSDIFTLEDALDMFTRLGAMLQVNEKAIPLKLTVQNSFNQLEKAAEKASVLYLIWKDPYLAAGKNTFIDNILSSCGYSNAVQTERYPDVDQEKNLIPDLIFLSSEPYPFKEKHMGELQSQYPNSKVFLVDGEMFSWYGSRLKYAVNYFNELGLKIQSS